MTVYFRLEKIYALKMIFELICGKGSKLYERLLNKQIITEPLVFDIITLPAEVLA